ncbi:MAG: HD domain-containing phosphohydrolase [Dehalococcoidia bacterium]
MNIITMLHFGAFLADVWLITYVMSINPGARLNRLCALLVATFAFWSLCYGLAGMASTVDKALFFINVSSIGYCFAPIAGLWCILAISNQDNLLDSKVFLLGSLVLPVFFIYQQMTGTLMTGVAYISWGWVALWSRSIYAYLFLAYVVISTLIGSYAVTRYVFQVKASYLKKRGILVIITGFIALAVAVITRILYQLGIFTIPQVADVIYVICGLGVVMAVCRYRLTTISPAAVSDVILSTMNDSLMLLNLNGRIIYANQATSHLLGVSARKLKGASFSSFVDVIDNAGDLLKETIATGGTVRRELSFKSRLGIRTPVLVSTSVVREPVEGVVGFVISAVDNTKSKLAEETINRQREEYRTIFDSVRPTIAYLDKEGVIMRINKAGAAAFGREPKEAVGRTIYDFFPVDEAVGFAAENNEVVRTGIAQLGIVSQYTLPSGAKRWAQIDRIPYRDRDGNIIGVIAVNQDITRRKLAEENLEKSLIAVRKNLKDAITTLAKIVEMRDPYTAGHQRRVATLATAIAQEMSLSEDQTDQVQMAAIVHDIGKIYIPSDILSKPARLTEVEFQFIKTHPRGGYDIVKGIDFPGAVADSVLQHHERMDGSGYPSGLKDNEILLEAKILAVADTVEAMASYRPYRPSLGIDKALEEISDKKGKLFNGSVVEACLRLFREKSFNFTD